MAGLFFIRSAAGRGRTFTPAIHAPYDETAPRGCDRGTDMKIDVDDFQVQAGDKVKLHKWPTRVAPVYTSKADYQALLQDHVGRLSALQAKLYAANRYAILLIFQAMDAAGAAARVAGDPQALGARTG